jgi:hypothetical protein
VCVTGGGTGHTTKLRPPSWSTHKLVVAVRVLTPFHCSRYPTAACHHPRHVGMQPYSTIMTLSTPVCFQLYLMYRAHHAPRTSYRVGVVQPGGGGCGAHAGAEPLLGGLLGVAAARPAVMTVSIWRFCDPDAHGFVFL